MNIDLSKYIGQEVIVTLAGGQKLIGTVNCDKHDITYQYTISSYCFSETGKGYSKPQIISIAPTNSIMNGIAQKHPNINLKDFEGQNVYVKCSDGKNILGKVLKTAAPNTWHITDLYGEVVLVSRIEEIYGEGAYEIKTKPIFDEPSDVAVEKAKEAIKDLTEEQIAKLLHNLKK